jgi:hypothetical protein
MPTGDFRIALSQSGFAPRHFRLPEVHFVIATFNVTTAIWKFTLVELFPPMPVVSLKISFHCQNGGDKKEKTRFCGQLRSHIRMAQKRFGIENRGVLLPLENLIF